MAPPPGFLDLATAYRSTSNNLVNIIGVVVDIQSPTLAKSGQYMFTFKLKDEALRDSLYGSQGLTVRFFKPDHQALPQVREYGDVVLLRKLKMTAFNQQPMGLSNYQTEVLVFPSALIPEPSYQIAYQDKKRLECLGVPMDVQRLTLQEQAYVIELKHEMDSVVQALPPMKSTPQMINAHPMYHAPLMDNAPPPNAPTGPAAMRQGIGFTSAASLMNKRSGYDIPSEASKKLNSSSFGSKYKQIHQLQNEVFADIAAQVVKKFSNNFGTCELYVTDYTANKRMYYYAAPEEKHDLVQDGDEYGYSGPSKRTWPGPFGWHVLKVDLMSPHAEYANREVNEGDFVLLQNVKIKVKDTGMAKLEGNMWEDSFNPEKILIRKLLRKNLPEIESILERKESYWNNRNAKLQAAEEQQGAKKKLTKTERKKQRKQQKREAEAEAKAKAADAESNRQNGAAVVPSKANLNPHIRCGHKEVQISSIESILDSEGKRHVNIAPDGMSFTLPFVNAKFRARGRVVDFAPKQLEDFAVPKLEPSDDDSENLEMMDIESSPTYEWSFSLLLEDVSNMNGRNTSSRTVWVTLGHQEAQYLFGNDVADPSDLKKDSALLSKLRDKLFTLWGDLEEQCTGSAATETVSNRPFECCLMEYGVEMDDDDPEKADNAFGFRRMYGMFGVTIT